MTTLYEEFDGIILEEVIYEVYLALLLLWGGMSLEDGGYTDGRRVFPEGSSHDETGCLCPSLKGDAVSIGRNENVGIIELLFFLFFLDIGVSRSSLQPSFTPLLL